MTKMPRTAVRVLTATLLLIVPLAFRPAEAQEDKLSFVFTPQVWMSNIPKNGFAAPASQIFLPGGGNVTELLTPGDTGPDSLFYPQWGGQFAAQYGRWTLGLTAQYVTFQTSTPLNFNQTVGTFPPGTTVNTETIDVNRVDTDLTLSYFFPDVIKDVLDVSAGGGLKWIHANGNRSLSDTKDFVTLDYAIPGSGPTGPVLTSRADFVTNYYGATIPVTMTFRLAQSGRWLLPVTMSPFLGWQGNADQVNGWKTSFAYGGTFDAGVRYVFDNGIAVYAGYRAQVIQGVNLYFAQGPLVNMSVRFGGK